MATYLMPAFTVAVGGAVAGALLGDAVGPRVGEGWAAGVAEHALANAAQITMRTTNSPFDIKQLVLSASPP